MTDPHAYQGRLEEEKARLEGQLATVGRRNPSNPTDWEAVPQGTGQEPDETDAADLQEGFGENAAILNDLEIRLTRVADALARIENGTFGKCLVGGEDIEDARLDADPSAGTCIAHKG
jgi:DnaK suppressor protein